MRKAMNQNMWVVAKTVARLSRTAQITIDSNFKFDFGSNFEPFWFE